MGTLCFQWDDVYFVLDQHAYLDFYSASSLKQHSTGGHVTPLRHIILILSQSFFALTTECNVINWEAANPKYKSLAWQKGN